MALSTDELNGIVAQWQEWTVDSGFKLDVEVKDSGTPAVVKASGELLARLDASLYCQVTVRRGKRVVFSERVDHNPVALRTSVTVLARTIAATCPSCNHPWSEHHRGHLQCLHTTEDETWACGCGGDE